jgi:DNA-binding Lrp family transcriptional regulator
MKAYVLIKIRAGEVKDVVRQLKKVENIIEAHMTFGPYDAVAVITAQDIRGLGSLIAIFHPAHPRRRTDPDLHSSGCVI